MQLLYLLEKIRLPGLNELMLALTTLGEETAFLVIAIVLFWCVDKRRGYYVMSVGFIGTIVNQFMKLLFRIPRPWVLDENFTILEQAREGASGYSFPSGHTQNAVGTFGGIAYTAKQKWVKIVCIALAVLIPFSRMYVGVHTPYDVLTAAVIALALVFALKPVFYKNEGKHIPKLLVGMFLLSAAYLCFVELYPFPADMDAYNLESGMKNAYTLFGCVAALLIVYFVDEKWLHFSTEAAWWAQILKVVLGVAVVLLVKEGTKAPLEAVFGGHMAARAVRYFLTVLVVGLVWPLTFRWFGKLGKKEK